MKTNIIEFNASELFDQARKTNPAVMSDEAKKAENQAAGFKFCDRCGGTGNELFFMYRRCEKCGGDGKAVDSETVQ